MHIHQQWDLQNSSVCEEGAAVGHACSNYSNEFEEGQVSRMRNAARAAKITTGKDPHPKQVLYGERALDMVFGFPLEVVRAFDMAKFL